MTRTTSQFSRIEYRKEFPKQDKTPLSSLILTIELVPATSWNSNLRSLLPKEAWDVLRKKVYADFHHRCAICYGAGMLDCHEVWSYDDLKHTQTLSNLIALCRLCHAVKHFGRTQATQEHDIEDVITHFMKVNSVSREVFAMHKHAAYRQFEERSQYQWQIHIGELQDVARIL